MAKPLPNHPQLRGNYAPINFEATCEDLVIRGKLPTDLTGSLYRVGPNPKFVPKIGYHWFFGAGMVHAFHFREGRVNYINRWVRTPKFLAEQTSGSALPMDITADSYTGQLQSNRRNGLANTNIIWHANQLLALEEGSHPFTLTPDKLETVGYGHYGDGISGAMTAHPKIDPFTGDLHGFGYMSNYLGSRSMSYHVIDSKGAIKRSDNFDAPYSAMVHDFIITEDYVLFPIFPLTFDLQRINTLGVPFAFEPNAGAFIGVVRRDDPITSIRWIEIPVCFIFHFMNAWNEKQKVTFDAIEFSAAPNFSDVFGKIPKHEDAQGKLTRWRLDITTGKIDREKIFEAPAEFPRIDDRFITKCHRHGYIASASKRQRGDGGLFNEITHLNLKSESVQCWDAGLQNGVSEPVFVPKKNDSSEGEGWLLATVFEHATKSSYLAIFNSEAVADGPIASCHLDHRIPFGFHGNWR